MFKSLNYNSKYFHYSTLFGLFFLNVFLKISFLGSEPFWYDEIVSVKASLLDFGHIKHQSEWDNNPPFYYYCLWVWVKLLGISEFKVRLLSVLFSSASVCLLYVLGKERFNYLTGLGASLLFTFHNFSYEYSHEARCYSLVVLLVLCSTIFFFKLLEDPSYKNVAWLGLFSFLIIYTHYIAGLVIFFQLIFILSQKKEIQKMYLASLAICILLVAIRFTKKQFLVMLSFNKEGKGFWLEKANTGLLQDALRELFSGNTVWLILLILFGSALVAAVLKRKEIATLQKQALMYSILLSFISITLVYVIGMYKPIFLGRYLLFTVPFILLLISWLLFNLRKGLSLLIIPLLALQMLYIELDPKKTMDYKLAVEVVKKLKANNNSMVILQTRDITALFAYYFNKEYFLDYKHLSDNLKKNRVFEIENYNDLNALPFKNENSIIFCQTFEKASDNNQIFDIFKQNNYAFVTTRSVRGVKISLLKKIKSI